MDEPVKITDNDRNIMARIKKFDAIRESEGRPPTDKPMRVNIDAKKNFTNDELAWRILHTQV
jgi:hypothetical protein